MKVRELSPEGRNGGKMEVFYRVIAKNRPNVGKIEKWWGDVGEVVGVGRERSVGVVFLN